MHSFIAFLLPLLLASFSACSLPPKSPPPPELRILCYNIHHARGTDDKLDLARIAAIINSVKPDLVALQEVDQNTTRTQQIDQAAELARLTGLRHVYGKAMDFQGGAYGQAILSRFPITSSKVHQLPQETNREPRILFTAQVSLPRGGTLIFASTHLDHQRNDIRVRQAEKIQQLLGQFSQPVILCGDFNAYPDSQPMTLLFKNWQDSAAMNPQPTISAANPTRRIDYILLRPKDKWAVFETKVPAEPVASDHRPVFARVQTPSPGI